MRGAKRRRVEDVRSSPPPIPDEELGFQESSDDHIPTILPTGKNELVRRGAALAGGVVAMF
jgi:hypothetical protein